MKKLISLLLFLSIAALAADVRWTFVDFTSSPQSVKKVYITPIAAYGTNSTNIVTGDRRTYTNNSSGSLIVSNVIVGRSYRVELQGPFTETVITNSFDSSVSGFVEAVSYISAPLSDGGLTSYSKTAADARFHNVSGDTSTNAAFRGTFKIPAGATVGYVLTVTNADGSSAWSPGSGGVATANTSNAYNLTFVIDRRYTNDTPHYAQISSSMTFTQASSDFASLLFAVDTNIDGTSDFRRTNYFHVNTGTTWAKSTITEIVPPGAAYGFTNISTGASTVALDVGSGAVMYFFTNYASGGTGSGDVTQAGLAAGSYNLKLGTQYKIYTNSALVISNKLEVRSESTPNKYDWMVYSNGVLALPVYNTMDTAFAQARGLLFYNTNNYLLSQITTWGDHNGSVNSPELMLDSSSGIGIKAGSLNIGTFSRPFIQLGHNANNYGAYTFLSYGPFGITDGIANSLPGQGHSSALIFRCASTNGSGSGLYADPGIMAVAGGDQTDLYGPGGQASGRGKLGFYTIAPIFSGSSYASYPGIMVFEMGTNCLAMQGTNQFIGNGLGITNLNLSAGIYATNSSANTNIIDLAKPYSAASIAGALTITALSGVSAYATNVQWATRFYTNTSGSAVNMTFPASWIGNTSGQQITNQSVISVVVYPGMGTNVIVRHLK